MKREELYDQNGIYCPHCGTKNIYDAVFCERCGKKIKSEGEANKSGKTIKIKAFVAILVITVVAALFIVIKPLLSPKTTLEREQDDSESVEEECIAQQTDLTENKISAKNSQEVLDKLGEGFNFIGIDNTNEELSLKQESETDGCKFYRYRQMYKGIPVYGHDAVIETSKDGYISIVNGNTVEVLLENTEPSIDETEAYNAAMDYLNISDDGLREYASAELCIYCRKGEDLLAYQVKLGPSTVMVDATTGDPIMSNIGVLFDNVELQGQIGKINVEVTRDGDDIVLEDKSRNIAVRSYEEEEKRAWTGDLKKYKLFKFDENHLGNPIRFNLGSNDYLSATDALDNIAKAYDFYSMVLVYDSVDGKGKASINIYDGIEKYLIPGGEEVGIVGNSCSCEDTESNRGYVFIGRNKKNENSCSADLSTMVHEYTHMVIGFTSGLHGNQKDQASGINEALADIMGELAEARYSNGKCDWIHGSRNIPEAENIITKSSQFKKTECHKASGVISHAAYLMWIGGDRSSEMMPINDVNVMATLWMKVVRSVTPDATFSQVRGLVEMYANEMSLDPKQMRTIRYAFEEAGVPLPTVTVSGKVVDKNGKALSGLNFQIKDANSGYVVFNGVTDADGRFHGYAREAEEAQYEIIEKNKDLDGNEKNTTWLSGNLPTPLRDGDNDLGEFKLNNYEILVVGIELSDIYINFIKSKSDAISYLIYDVDKDNYPEVFIERHVQEDRAFVFDIYTYKDGNFEQLGTEYGPGGHISPIYASYPDGNGVLEYSVGKGKELIQLHKWVDGEHSDETVYLEDASGKFYRDVDDQMYDESYHHNAFINHQFYKSENSSPLYEGSLLLAQNSPDDFTAVHEALDGNGEAVSETRDDSKAQNQDEISIDTLKSFVGKLQSEIPYDTTSMVWGDRNCYETVNNIRMYEHDGKVRYEFRDDVVIDAFWVCDSIKHDEIEQIIQDIREITGLDEQELYEDELYWSDASDNVEYYITFHEIPITVGVQELSAQQGGSAAIAQDVGDYSALLSKYSTAIAENWNRGRLGDEGLNYQLPDIGDAGYFIEDINNDGISELMIGSLNPPYEDYQNAILDMYTLDNGEPKKVFSGTEKVFGYLSDDRILVVVDHDGAEAKLYQYDFLDPVSLEFYTTDSVCYDGFHDPDNPWYSDFSHIVSFTEEEAKNIMALYPIQSIGYTPLVS